MTVERLREAADDLENLALPPSSEFDMSHYGEHKGGHEPPDNNYCGTSACAAGWLSLMPKWYNRGMKSEWSKDAFGNWALQPLSGKHWDDLTAATFGDDLGPIAQELVFERTRYTREEAIKEMREIADNFEEDESYYDEAMSDAVYIP